MKTVTFDPELWKLVPIKLTRKMLFTSQSADSFSEAWDNALDSAPQPPAGPLKDLSDDEILQMAASVMIRVREAAYKRKPKFNYTVEIARMAIPADRKLNGIS